MSDPKNTTSHNHESCVLIINMKNKYEKKLNRIKKQYQLKMSKMQKTIIKRRKLLYKKDIKIITLRGQNRDKKLTIQTLKDQIHSQQKEIQALRKQINQTTQNQDDNAYISSDNNDHNKNNNHHADTNMFKKDTTHT
eukprot:505764_1